MKNFKELMNQLHENVKYNKAPSGTPKDVEALYKEFQSMENSGKSATDEQHKVIKKLKDMGYWIRGFRNEYDLMKMTDLEKKRDAANKNNKQFEPVRMGRWG